MAAASDRDESDRAQRARLVRRQARVGRGGTQSSLAHLPTGARAGAPPTKPVKWPLAKAKTERAGFEPAMEFDPHTRLAGECLQPLGHLSLSLGGQFRASFDRTPAIGVASRTSCARSA